MNKRLVDVIVIGGGIIGLTTAYELGKKGIATTLVDAYGMGSQQSSRNWGFVRQQGRSTEELPLMRAAVQKWAQLEQELPHSIGWRVGGNLALASSPTKARLYQDWLSIGHSEGLDTKFVDEQAIRQIIPELSIQSHGGIFTASDGQAEPEITCRGLHEAVQALGVRIITGHKAIGIQTKSGQVTGIQLQGHEALSGDLVVCAAGAGSRRLLQSCGIHIPQVAIRSTVGLTAPVKHFTDLTVWTGNIAFRQRKDGRLIFAAGGLSDVFLSTVRIGDIPYFLKAYLNNRESFRLRPGWSRSPVIRDGLGTSIEDPCLPDTRQATQVLERLARALKIEDRLIAERFWAGMIDVMPDSRPIIERLGAPTGLVMATGLSGHGFGLAPVIGQIVADLCVSGNTKFDLSAFQLRRFIDKTFTPADNIL